MQKPKTSVWIFAYDARSGRPNCSTDLVVTAVHYKISDIEGFLCGCVLQQCSLECTKALWASSTPRFPASSRSATQPGHPGFLPNTHWDGLYPLTRPMLFLVLRVSCKQILKSLSSVASESATTRLSIAFITPWALSTFPMAVGVSEDNFKAVRGQKPLYHASVMYPPVTGDLFWPTGPANPTVNHGVGTALGCWHSTSNLDNFSQVETSGDIHKAEYGILVASVVSGFSNIHPYASIELKLELGTYRMLSGAWLGIFTNRASDQACAFNQLSRCLACLQDCSQSLRRRMSKLTVQAPDGNARALWEPSPQ